MARRGAIGVCIVSMVLAASLRVAAAADFDRLPAAPQLAPGELTLLALVVQRESENQPFRGQEAVAWTAVNRLRAGIYGRTLREVLQRPYQYARPKRRDPNSPAYRTALMAALTAVRGEGEDVSRSATHFIRCDMKRRPAWTRKMTMTIRIHSHCFWKLREPKS